MTRSSNPFSTRFNSRNALAFSQRLHREISQARANIFDLMRAELNEPNATAEQLTTIAFIITRRNGERQSVDMCDRVFKMQDFLRDLGAAQTALLDASRTFIKDKRK